MHMRKEQYQKDTGKPQAALPTKVNELLSYLHNIRLTSELLLFSSSIVPPCSTSSRNTDRQPIEQSTITQVRLLQVADTC